MVGIRNCLDLALFWLGLPTHYRSVYGLGLAWPVVDLVWVSQEKLEGKEGRKEGREGGREGRKEGREGGREGRKEGRTPA